MDSDDLIARLARDAKPVRRLAPPWMGALAWLAVAGLFMGGVVAVVGLRHDLEARLGLMSEQLNLVFAGATAVLAALGAFHLARPDGDARWAWVPVAPALGWIAGMGAGCIGEIWRGGLVMGTSFECARFIVGFGVPLTLSMLWMVRHAALTRPVEVAALAGLAASAMAALGLALVHHLDAAAMVLVWHGGSVALSVWVAKRWGTKALAAMGPRLTH